MWPIGGVTTVRHYIKDCVGCKIRRRVRGEQLMAPLPSVRLKSRTHVFAYVASDLAGPFRVVVGSSHVKRWLCVFVCMVTTAVRIEIAADLTSSSFINAFRRFLCSAGFRTCYIRTDNVTNYVGANNLLRKEVKEALADMSSSTDIQSQMYEWEVQREFGPPEASHQGGLYERQLRTIKKALDGLSDLLPRTPSDDDFLTCCKLAEYIMNCRPLTKPDDDGLPPLRPIDLMVGALEPSYDYIYPCVSRPRDELRKGHRYTQQIAQLWWDRWVNVYTVMLQERQKWRKTRREFKVGDLILLCEEPAPRILKYPFAVITDVSPSPDGHVRTVTARMSDGRLRTRDITKIALVDAIDNESDELWSIE